MNTISTPPNGPFQADHALWLTIDDLARGLLRLESGANILPLCHVASYYACLALVIVLGADASYSILAVLWALIFLLNYSLSIGVLHMHAHRKLFTAGPLNRALEFLLCFPCILSFPMMLYIHVYLHHKHENGPDDPTTTSGYERGWRAAWYWTRYAYVCQKHTILGLFRSDAAPAWKALRKQYLVDTLGTLTIVTSYLLLVDPWQVLVFWEAPLVLVSVNIGFFAWITHAPASSRGLNGSFNTTNNLMNIFIHNQGYHLVHHRYPSIHWTRIPDRLDLMLGVEDRFIAPYWVVLLAAWRVIIPRFLYDPEAGRAWKARYERKSFLRRRRLSWLPYFGWI